MGGGRWLSAGDGIERGREFEIAGQVGGRGCGRRPSASIPLVSSTSSLRNPVSKFVFTKIHRFIFFTG